MEARLSLVVFTPPRSALTPHLSSSFSLLLVALFHRHTRAPAEDAPLEEVAGDDFAGWAYGTDDV